MGFGLWGAIAGGIVAILIYTRRNKLNTNAWLDIAALAALLGQTIGRWGNFFNQELYGTVTNLPWGITITNVNQRLSPYNDLTQYPLDTTFHPVFLYESVWTLLGFFLALWIFRNCKFLLRDGNLFALYLIWYGLGRFAIEALRPDAWTIAGVAVAQMVSVVAIGLGSWLLYRQRLNR